MPNGDAPREAEFDEASAQLNDGLRTCRAVINDYRAMLTGERGAERQLFDGSTRDCRFGDESCD